MKPIIVPWDESFLDIEDYQVERAAVRGAITAIHRTRQFGTCYIIEDEGRTKSIKAEDTGPYEKQLLERLEGLNQKISSLRQQSDSLVLNDAPVKNTDSK